MDYQTLSVTQADKILRIQLNRADKLNALSDTLLRELRAALDAVRHDDDVSVVVIKAASKAFTVGYDMNESDWILGQYPANFEGAVDIDKDREDIGALLDYWLALWQFPKPIIAQVQGLCLSGGGELLAVCDLVVASDQARFGHPAGRDLGIPPTVFFWPLLIGMKKTRELLYTAKLIDAAEAERLGLVNQVTTAEALEATVDALAADIAKTPVNHLTLLKQATSRWYENMGLFASCRNAAELDAVFHQSPSYVHFFNLVKEQGMQAALADRKARYE